MNLNWFHRGVVYQIYPKSFNDTTGNGIGDLKGIVEKLDYLMDLHVDIIWISPIFKSPNKDNGYDISNYYAIDEEYGTIADLEKLLSEAHKRGLRIIFDLVPNHTSTQHKWFKASEKDRSNPFRDYYIWRKPGPEGGPPNNWQSFFGGSAWTFSGETHEYYLHLYTKHQPDLNWDNPEVRQHIYDVMNYWLEKGIDGFRIDVVTLLSKDRNFRDIDENLGFRKIIENHYANGPNIHNYLHEMYDKVMKDRDAFTMGEGVGVTSDNAHLYVDSNRQELDMIYHFDVLENNIVDGKYEEVTNFNLDSLKSVFRKWQTVIDNNGWIINAMGNHDFARMVSRFGDDEKYHEESAKMLITLLATQNGTLNIYQGDEIGMTNATLTSAEQIDDVEAKNFYKENTITKKYSDQVALNMINDQGRDNARTPMQWNTSEHGGFSSDKAWLAVNQNYTHINVANQQNTDTSILSYYKKILKLRREHEIFYCADLVEIDENNPCVYAYEKKKDSEKIIVFLSFSSKDEKIRYDFLPELDYHVMINNYENIQNNTNEVKLKPYQSIIINAN